MRAAVAFVLVLAPALAAAQDAGTPASAPSVEVATIRAPLDLHASLTRSSEHGCSQSHESSEHAASVGLAVDARGRATFTLDATTFRVSGPSFGRYQRGDHEFSNLHQHARLVLSGTASTVAGTLTVRFTAAERAFVAWTGYGSLPLPAPTVTSYTATLTCQLARRDVLPEVLADGEQPVPLSLVECTFDRAPTDLEPFETLGIILGAGTGVVTSTRSGMWADGGPPVLRRAPPAP